MPTRSSDDKEAGKLVYTPRNSKTTVELFVDNLKCLAPNTYLNDEVVQFYTAYLLAECCRSPKRMFVFDNLFHGLLRVMFEQKDMPGSQDSKSKPKAWSITTWRQLENWYSNVNIFEKDFLIFPVCQESHWFAIVVCYPNEVRDFNAQSKSPDSESSWNNKPVPGVIILDSLGANNPLASNEVRYFLDFEWRTRCTVIKDFFYHELKQFQPKLPKQTNDSDCGIFMLAYLKAFVQDPEKFYELARKGRNKKAEADLAAMVNDSLSRCAREPIKNLIRRLCQGKRRNEP